MNSHNFENEREVYVCICQLRDRFCLTLFLERIRIQLPRPGMPSLGIEVDVLIQLPRPGTPSLGIEFDVLIQLPRPGMPSLGIEAHYFRGYDALVQG